MTRVPRADPFALLLVLACGPSGAPQSPPSPLASSTSVSSASVPATTSAPVPSVVSSASAGPPSGTVPNVTNTIAMLSKDFRQCFERGLEQDSSMHGALRVRIVVGPGGVVKEAQATRAAKGEPGLSDAVISCVESLLRATTFGPPEGGTEATVLLPLSFVPDALPPSPSGAPSAKKAPKKPKP